MHDFGVHIGGSQPGKAAVSVGDKGGEEKQGHQGDQIPGQAFQTEKRILRCMYHYKPVRLRIQK